MPKKTKEQLLRERVKIGLLDQMARRQVTQPHYLDMVSDYMSLWDTKTKLVADIKSRGVTVTSASGAGLRKNDSITELVKVNGQMLKILDSLGLEPEPEEGLDDEM